MKSLAIMKAYIIARNNFLENAYLDRLSYKRKEIGVYSYIHIGDIELVKSHYFTFEDWDEYNEIVKELSSFGVQDIIYRIPDSNGFNSWVKEL